MGLALTACGADNKSNNSDANTGSNVSESGNADTGAGGEQNSGNSAGGTNEDGAGANEGSANGSSDSGAANDEGAAAEEGSTQAIADAILAKFEQPSQMKLEGDMVKDMYHLDPALLEDYTIMTPLMNIKTNELAVLKVKDAKDLEAVQEGVKQRAADVQKVFETYLQDQYENAKNYKLVVKGSYVLFVISENADDMAAEFEALVK
ncbi:DUF4358 domain-containing protein [Paenibacillus nanensis]|uniref:DUF4358 domain-containing protein n=2 Tax=Paenibacillus nanensis TaxID=393251 RepID=A0A3A1VJL8_9BACL|nr:DUF4358 domain-containing protein [Paenibacillus nanensis]